jgi:hypothetical protein
MGTPSEKQIAANRLNALKSTGPKTPEGKARSRRNGLVHGLTAEVVVPEEDRLAFEAEMARWEHEAGPSNVVEAHLIRRAAVGSVRLNRIEQAQEATRQKSARDAVELWARRQQARARKKGQLLPLDPSNVLPELESSAFGCDWLIRRWQANEASLRVGKALDQLAVTHMQHLLGLPHGLPCDGADPVLRGLWILAAAWSPTKVTALPRLTEPESRLPTDPEAARQALLAFIADRVDRLERLRDESWGLVEGPDRDAVALLAAAADTSKEGQLRHRYEVAADRSTNAAVRLFLNNRDRRLREHLEISKEARQYGTPRAPVGGGWWCEFDADPAPPGFQRIDPTPAPEPPPEPGPPPEADPGPIDSPSPRLAGPGGPDADRPGAAHTASCGAPLRSEPISPAEPPASPIRKSFQSFTMHHEPPNSPGGTDRRTGPSPSPSDRPPGDAHPPGGPSHPGLTGTAPPSRTRPADGGRSHTPPPPNSAASGG